MENFRHHAPVFICGYPKAGTTLLLALLDRHPELLVFPEETHYFSQIMGHPERQNPDYILSETSVKALGLGKIRYTSGYRDYTGVNFDIYQNCLQEGWEASEQTDRDLFEAIVGCYGLASGQINKKYWVEKTPFNERHLRKAQKLWPAMKAIYIIRDPRDNFCSYNEQRTRRHVADLNKASETDLDSREEKSHRLSPSLSIEEFVANWLDSVYLWKTFNAKKKNKGLLIRYDDLVSNPKAEMLRVCEFLGIAWDDNLLVPTRNGSLWSGNSMHGAKFSGISTASLGRYRKMLNHDEIIFLESCLQPTMQRFHWGLDLVPIKKIEFVPKFLFSRKVKSYYKAKFIQGFFRQVFW